MRVTPTRLNGNIFILIHTPVVHSLRYIQARTSQSVHSLLWRPGTVRYVYLGQLFIGD